jgi:hypothetical protein
LHPACWLFELSIIYSGSAGKNRLEKLNPLYLLFKRAVEKFSSIKIWWKAHEKKPVKPESGENEFLNPV